MIPYFPAFTLETENSKDGGKEENMTTITKYERRTTYFTLKGLESVVGFECSIFPEIPGGLKFLHLISHLSQHALHLRPLLCLCSHMLHDLPHNPLTTTRTHFLSKHETELILVRWNWKAVILLITRSLLFLQEICWNVQESKFYCQLSGPCIKKKE